MEYIKNVVNCCIFILKVIFKNAIELTWDFLKMIFVMLILCIGFLEGLLYIPIFIVTGGKNIFDIKYIGINYIWDKVELKLD